MPETVCLGVYRAADGWWWTEIPGFADDGPHAGRNDAYRAGLELVLAAGGSVAVTRLALPAAVAVEPAAAGAPARRTFIRYFEKTGATGGRAARADEKTPAGSARE